MLHKKTSYRELINSDHRLKYLLDKYLTSTERLVELYEDKDGQRKAEVASLTGPNEFQEFYSRLKQIKDFYRKHPNEISVPMSVEFDELAKARENPTEEMSIVQSSSLSKVAIISKGKEDVANPTLGSMPKLQSSSLSKVAIISKGKEDVANPTLGSMPKSL
ncbi:Splicing factor SF3a60 binding domain [Popillia japonica]